MPKLSAHVGDETAEKVDDYSENEGCESRSDAINELLSAGLRAEGYSELARYEMATGVARYSLVVAIAWFAIWIGTPITGAYLLYSSVFMIGVSWSMMAVAALSKDGSAPSSLDDIRRSVRGWLS